MNENIVHRWLFPIFRAVSEFRGERIIHLWRGYPLRDLFFDVFIRIEIFLCKCVCHRLKQVIVGRGTRNTRKAQTDNLFSVEIPCDCLTRFQQLVVHYILLIPPNTEHCLLSVDIPFWRRCRWLTWITNDFSAFGIIEIDPLFIASHNSVQKPLSLLPSKQILQILQMVFRLLMSLGFSSYRTYFPFL